MDITKDIQPMTTFRNHSAEFMAHIKTTGRPMILTVNGKAAAVVQDAEAYQNLLDLAAGANAAEGIRQGLEDMEAGRVRPAAEVLEDLRARHDIPRGPDESRRPRPSSAVRADRRSRFCTGQGVVQRTRSGDPEPCRTSRPMSPDAGT